MRRKIVSLLALFLAASLLRRISRNSGMTPDVLSRRACVPLPALMAAMNGERPLPAKDYIRVSMVSGVLAADVAFEGR